MKNVAAIPFFLWVLPFIRVSAELTEEQRTAKRYAEVLGLYRDPANQELVPEPLVTKLVEAAKQHDVVNIIDGSGLHVPARVVAKAPRFAEVIERDLGLALKNGHWFYKAAPGEGVSTTFKPRCLPMDLSDSLEAEMLGAVRLNKLRKFSIDHSGTVPTPKNVIPVVMARLLGNDMPPLHGTHQSLHNTEIILDYEDCPVITEVSSDLSTTYSSVSSKGRKSQRVPGAREANWPSLIVPTRCQRGGFPSSLVNPPRGRYRLILHQMRVVNRIMDGAEYFNIKKTLRHGYQQSVASTGGAPDWVSEIPYLEVPITRHQLVGAWSPPIYLTNLNRARNWALQETAALGAKWTMPLDGNIFVPPKGYSGLARAFVRAEARGKQYLLHPFFRMEDENSDANIRENRLTLPELINDVAMYEAQISIRRGSPINFYNDARYGYRDKYSLFMSLKPKTGVPDRRECADADIGYFKTANLTEDQPLVEKCGYMLRMPYWPDVPRPESYSYSLKGRYIVRLRSLLVLRLRLAEADGLYNYLKRHARNVTVERGAVEATALAAVQDADAMNNYP